MDDTEDPYAEAQGFESLPRPKIRIRNVSYPHKVGDEYAEGDDDTEVDERNEERNEEEEEEEEEGDGNEEDIIQLNGNEEDIIQLNGKAEDVSDEDDVVVEEDGDGDDSDHDDENNPNDYRRIESADQHRQPKKRKMKSLLSSYEFAPRVPAPIATTRSVSKHGGRNALSDWTEHETFVLLDAWGDRFLQRGRKSLRSEEWQEVAEKVSQESRLERTDTQCRNRLDTLKKKYKKEKMKLQETMDTSKWVYFKKMNMLLSSTPQQPRLSRRVNSVNSGEYVSQYTRVPLNRACGIDELSNSPEISESVEAEENSSDLLPPKRTNRGDGGSFRLLAESITKFSDIYEKIESSKRKQMLELERMRMDFFRELEMQKRQILERARAEIASIRRGDDERIDGSAENFSG